jgi:hypothetical protein
MKYSRLLKATGVTGLAVAALVGGQAPAVAADANYVLNTASTGGTYHPVGTAISTLTKIKLLPKQKPKSLQKLLPKRKLKLPMQLSIPKLLLKLLRPCRWPNSRTSPW